MRKALKLLAPMLLVAAMATPARADFNLALGLKWDPAVYTTPVGYQTDNNGNATVNKLYGFQTTSLNSYVGFFFTEQIGVHLSLDFGWSNFNQDTTNNGNKANFNSSFFQFGFGLGGKFYLNRPSRSKVSPYLWANFFKYFTAIGTNANINSDSVGFLASQFAPIGFEVAFGAEYFFMPSFSLGAEILGLRFAHIESNTPNSSLSQNYFSLYGAISLNYRFALGGGGGGGRTYDDEPRPRPRPRRPPPPEDGSPEQVE